jgi:hypothetical protein
MNTHTKPLFVPTDTGRRSFLRRAVTALAAGAAVNATAIVATRPALADDLKEDPAIIALGQRIEPLLAAYRNAAEERLKARAVAEANCPAVPEELVCDWMGHGLGECDVEGKEILHDVFTADGKKCALLPRRILNSEETKAAIARGTSLLRSADDVRQEGCKADRDRGKIRSRT